MFPEPVTFPSSAELIQDLFLARLILALLKAQVSLQLGNVFSSDNGVSLSIMYSYTYIAYG